MCIEILVKISVLEFTELKEMFVYTSVFSAGEETTKSTSTKFTTKLFTRPLHCRRTRILEKL